MPTSIPIRVIRSKLYQLDKYATITFYLKDIYPSNRKITFIRIKREIYISKDLKTNILIRADIVTLESIVLDFTKYYILIGSFQDLTIPISTRIRLVLVKSIVKSRARLIVPARSITPISILFNGELLEDRDLFFKLDYYLNFS